MAFPLDWAELLALFLENIVFGIFLTFFIILVAICFAKDSIRIANRKFVLSVATVMMVLAIAGFATGDTRRLPNPIPYYSNVANPLHATKNSIYGLQTLLGDAVLVWRCYVVYNKSLYVLIPAGTVLLANIALVVLIIWGMLVTASGINDYQTGAWRFASSFFIATMGLNICCTIAIVFKIWKTHQRASLSDSRQSLFPVIAAIVESGALYSASVSGLVITYLSKSNGQFPALDLITPLVGVVFCLILLQIHLQLRLLKPLTTNMCSRSIQFGWRSSGSECANAAAVHISEHHVHTDPESDFILIPKTV